MKAKLVPFEIDFFTTDNTGLHLSGVFRGEYITGRTPISQLVYRRCPTITETHPDVKRRWNLC